MNHQWKMDGSGPYYHEPVDGHGGPLCERCGYSYCTACHPEGPPEPECEPDSVDDESDGPVLLDCSGLTIRALRNLIKAIESGDAVVFSLLEGPVSGARPGRQRLVVEWDAPRDRGDR